MKKKLLALVLSTACCVSMAGCSVTTTTTSTTTTASSEASEETAEAAEEASDESDGEVVTLNFYEHSDNEKVATQQVEAWNAAHPDVQVNLSIIANDDYDDKIKVMLAGDADVDVLWVRSGNIRQMGVDGALLDLSDMINERGIDYSLYGGVGETCIDGDHIYGMCTTKSCWLLWYNKTLFDEAGLDVNDVAYDITWDEFADLCQQLTTDDKMGGLTVNWSYLIGAQSEGEYLCDNDELPYTRKYAEFLHRIWVEDQSNYSLEEMSGSFDVNGTFAEGNTYMMINGDWNFLLFPDAGAEFEWGALPLPHFEDQEVNDSMGSVSAYCINSKSEHAKEAMDFIQFCTYSDEGASIYAENQGVAAYPSDAALAVYQENCDVPGTEYVFAANCNLEDGPEANYSEVKDAFGEEIQEYLLDSCTLDEAMDNFLARRDEILAK